MDQPQPANNATPSAPPVAVHIPSGPRPPEAARLPFPVSMEQRERLIAKIERQIETIEARETRCSKARAAAKEASEDLNDSQTQLRVFVRQLRDLDELFEQQREGTLPLTASGNGHEPGGEERLQLAETPDVDEEVDDAGDEREAPQSDDPPATDIDTEGSER